VSAVVAVAAAVFVLLLVSAAFPAIVSAVAAFVLVYSSTFCLSTSALAPENCPI
jgi:hypothetical protein